MERAKTLMGLFEIKARLTQQENAGLTKARENVKAIRMQYEKIQG